MNLYKLFKKYPFLMMLGISSLILTLIGFAGKKSIYSDYRSIHADTPQLAVVLEGAGEGKYPWMMFGHTEKKSELPDAMRGKDNEEQNDKQSKAASVAVFNKNALNPKSLKKPLDGKNTMESTVITKAAKKEYSFKKVSNDYFKNALFIGDSRTVGLSEYSNLKKSTFYADVGLTIYDVFDKKIAKVNGSNTTILKALHKKKFKKIYIMLGINELGTGTADTFTKQYKNVIAKIQKLQPDAIIYIESIMNVSKEKSDSDPVYNNVNIKKRNDHIAKLADNSKVFYLNINEAVTDKKGYLPSKYTFDYIHLKAAYYKLWTDYLSTHGVVDKAEASN